MTLTCEDVLFFTVDWRNREATNRLISSLSRFEIDLWVIVNDDLPDTYAIPPGANIDVQIHCCGRNTGFAAACNIAVQTARATSKRFILHFNNDVEVNSDDGLEKFIEIAGTDTNLGMASPTIASPDGTVEFSGSHPLAAVSSALIVARHKIPDVGTETIQSTRFVNGACFIADVEKLRRVGGFDEGFFAYREEHDLTARLARAGFTLGYIPCLCVTHHRSSSSDRDIQFKSFLMLRGQIRYMRKNVTILALPAFCLILLAKVTVKSVVAMLRWDLGYFNALYDVVRNQIFGKKVVMEILGERLVFEK